MSRRDDVEVRDLDVDEFVQWLRRGDHTQIGRVVAQLMERGVAERDLLLNVLAPAQERVGQLWETNQWTVAHEHNASAAVDAVLASLARNAVPNRGVVVVACAEEEWHILPARMFAELLRLDGWDTIFLPGSVPADHLAAFVQETRPIAVAISCSVPIFLAGAMRSIQAAHRADTAVITGGRAFGTDNRRATAIGADAWAASADDASRVLERLAGLRTNRAPSSVVTPREYLELVAHRAELVEQAMTALTDRFPPLLHYNEQQRAHTRQDLSFVLQFLEAAVLTDDARIIADFVPWFTTILTTRGIPGAVVPLTFETLASLLPTGLDDSTQLLQLARQHATAH